jgi:hypothetical protein
MMVGLRAIMREVSKSKKSRHKKIGKTLVGREITIMMTMMTITIQIHIVIKFQMNTCNLVKLVMIEKITMM